MALVHPDIYSQRSGLRWDDPTFIRSERLHW